MSAARRGGALEDGGLQGAGLQGAESRVGPRRGILDVPRFAAWVTFDAIRDFVWGDVKDGVIDLRGLGPAVRALIWIGFALLFVTLGLLLQSDTWRTTFDLIPLTQGIPGRGRLVPSALVPATLFLLAVAWAFILAGALRAHWAVLATSLVLYCMTVVGWFTSSRFEDVLPLLVGVGELVVLLVFVAVRRRGRPRPAFDCLVLLMLVASSSATLQAQGLASWRTSGMPVMVTRTSFDVLGLTSLISPLLLLVGVGIAGFVAKLAGWGVAISEDRLPRWSPYGLSIAAVGWALWAVLPPALVRFAEAPRTELLAMVNAVGVPLLVGLVWVSVRRLARSRQPGAAAPTVEDVSLAADRWSVWLIASYTAPVLASVALSQAALMFAVFAMLLGVFYEAQGVLMATLGALSGSTFQLAWHVGLQAMALGVATWLARRGQQAAALFLGIYAVLDLKSELTADGMLLSAFSSPVAANRADLVWTLILVGAAAYWYVRRELTRRAIVHVLFIALMLILLTQTDFISNRFSPFFGFAGVAFLAFGIAWDALTIGSWANVDSRRLPRTSRIFLYLGYVLATVTVVNWAVASHDLTWVGRLTGDIGLAGFSRFGRPLIYAIIAATLALPRFGEAGPEEVGVEDPDGEGDVQGTASATGAGGAMRQSVEPATAEASGVTHPR